MIIISKTAVDLTTLFGCIEEYSLNNINKKSGENNINTYLKSINNPNLLRHTYYSFLTLIHDHVIFDVYESLDLELVVIDRSVTPKIAVITGSLEQWKTAIVKGCNMPNKYELNTMLSAAYSKFKNTENLGYLWADYKSEINKQQQLKFLELK